MIEHKEPLKHVEILGVLFAKNRAFVVGHL